MTKAIGIILFFLTIFATREYFALSKYSNRGPASIDEELSQNIDNVLKLIHSYRPYYKTTESANELKTISHYLNNFSFKDTPANRRFIEGCIKSNSFMDDVFKLIFTNKSTWLAPYRKKIFDIILFDIAAKYINGNFVVNFSIDENFITRQDLFEYIFSRGIVENRAICSEYALNKLFEAVVNKSETDIMSVTPHIKMLLRYGEKQSIFDRELTNRISAFIETGRAKPFVNEIASYILKFEKQQLKKEQLYNFKSFVKSIDELLKKSNKKDSFYLDWDILKDILQEKQGSTRVKQLENSFFTTTDALDLLKGNSIKENDLVLITRRIIQQPTRLNLAILDRLLEDGGHANLEAIAWEILPSYAKNNHLDFDRIFSRVIDLAELQNDKEVFHALTIAVMPYLDFAKNEQEIFRIINFSKKRDNQKLLMLMSEFVLSQPAIIKAPQIVEAIILIATEEKNEEIFNNLRTFVFNDSFQKKIPIENKRQWQFLVNAAQMTNHISRQKFFETKKLFISAENEITDEDWQTIETLIRKIISGPLDEGDEELINQIIKKNNQEVLIVLLDDILSHQKIAKSHHAEAFAIELLKKATQGQDKILFEKIKTKIPHLFQEDMAIALSITDENLRFKTIESILDNRSQSHEDCLNSVTKFIK